MAKHILKVTQTKAVIAVVLTTAASETIDLQTDLLTYQVPSVGAGTISVSTAGTAVSGTNTVFTSAWVGAMLYTTAGVYIGTVATYTSGTSIALVANSAVTYNGTYRVSFKETMGATQYVDIDSVKFSVQPTQVGKIIRNSVDVLEFYGTDHWQFDGYSLNYNNTYDIVVTLAGAGTVILELAKKQGYNPTVPNLGV